MVMVERDAAVGWWDARYLDWAGAVASGLCALHCALRPMVAAALPIIGLGLLAGERAEAVLIGASAALGTISLALGFRRHRSGRDAAGLGLLWSRGASIGGELPPMGSRCEVDRSSEVMPSERTGTRRRSRRRI